MILKVFSVYDSVAETYTPALFLKTKGEAIRAFTDAVNDEKSQYFDHTADYSLFELGSYDTDNSTFSLLDCKVCMCNLLELKSSS